MSDRDDILHRLRRFRDQGASLVSADRQLVSEAIAEITELRGRAIQAEVRAQGATARLERELQVKAVQATETAPPTEVKQSPVPKTRGRAIRMG